MFRKLCAVVLITAFVFPSAAEAKFFKFGLDKAEVQEIVKEYLLENPEVVRDALENYAKKENEIRMKAMVSKLKSNRKALEHDPSTPVLGNPDGDVTVVEFFDYNCGYCKLMFPKVWEYVQNDGNIRWVLKDMPALGETSRLAALAGMAAEKQGKYFEMHQAMMLHEGSLTKEDIYAFAKENGLDMDKFEKDIKDPSFERRLNANSALAEKFEFRGIPNFVIGDFVSPGAMMGNELDEAVTAARSKE